MRLCGKLLEIYFVNDAFVHWRLVSVLGLMKYSVPPVYISIFKFQL